ncbi:MAG: hypothetical protein QM690_08255 [Sphingobium sp.]
MSEAAIERLALTERTLRGAMEDGDPRKIEEALTAFIAALETVRGIGAWRPGDSLKNTLRDLRTRLDSDQRLARLLTDLTQQKLDLLAGTTPQAIAPTTYKRRG